MNKLAHLDLIQFMGDDLVINLKKAFVFMSTMLALISVSCTSSMIIKLNSDESASFSSNSKPIDYERYLNSNIIYNSRLI